LGERERYLTGLGPGYFDEINEVLQGCAQS